MKSDLAIDMVPAVPAMSPGRYSNNQKAPKGAGVSAMKPEVKERVSFIAAIISNCL